jgi:hypothetical protein
MRSSYSLAALFLPLATFLGGAEPPARASAELHLQIVNNSGVMQVVTVPVIDAATQTTVSAINSTSVTGWGCFSGRNWCADVGDTNTQGQPHLNHNTNYDIRLGTTPTYLRYRGNSSGCSGSTDTEVKFNTTTQVWTTISVGGCGQVSYLTDY